MVVLKTKVSQCINRSACSSRLKYNYEAELNALYCARYKVRKTNKRQCLDEICGKRPTYNFENEKKAIYCSTHKKDNMVDIVNKRCADALCSKQPAFNDFGSAVAKYCTKHKKPGMVNVKSKRCADALCSKRPTFNDPVSTVAKYCTKHKKPGMVDVKNKRCADALCSKHPAFNDFGSAVAKYCTKHKKHGMVNVISKRCADTLCSKQPVFNDPGSALAKYCTKHKKPGMVDVKSKRCVDALCSKRPVFNDPGSAAAKYCMKHKKDSMVNIVNKQCIICTSSRANRKYKNHCLRCFIKKFPEEPNVRNYKTKEFAVVDHIRQMFPQYTWTHDRRVDNGCSGSKPDLYLDMGFHIIIIEIDENQHETYETICENKRMMQLSLDVGHTPIVLIRFNPDKYDNVTSCWYRNNLDICVVKKSKSVEWQQRLNHLTETVAFYCQEKNKSDRTLLIESLFYDQDKNEEDEEEEEEEEEEKVSYDHLWHLYAPMPYPSCGWISSLLFLPS